MSRRRQARREGSSTAPGPSTPPRPERPDRHERPPAAAPAAGRPAPSLPRVPLRERLRRATVPAAALLPMRFFFGITFLYAGLDKLLDAGFFDPADPGSLAAQMTGFARHSPIGGLVTLFRPEAPLIGLLIAVAEIAIGLGALTGLAFRLAAIGGALLSFLFFLTVSWSTTPYYLGPDLPYAVGWLSLAIAGHGDLLVPRRFRFPPRTPAGGAVGRRSRDPAPMLAERRALLQTGALAVAAVAVSSLALPMRLLGFEHPARTPAPASAPSGPPPSGLSVASVADVERRGSVAFTIPFDAPTPLPAGDPAVIVRLLDGTYAAFDAVCTHAGCTVEFSSFDDTILCPCHGAVFDPENGAAVLAGPAREPLATLPIAVDPASGRILLRT